MEFNWCQFSELSNQQLYALLALRSRVFVVEQSCVYLDADHRDQAAYHLMVEKEGQLQGYLRVIPSTLSQPLSFGRIVTEPGCRGQGIAKQLMSEMLLFCNNYFSGEVIHCSAQNYLRQFYESFGFVAEGEVYAEDGIDHVAMFRA